KYIKPNWPEVTEWQLSMINFGYGIRGGLAPENQVYISAPWTKENVLDRGPLGAMYRVWGDGKQMAKGDKTDYFGLSGVTADRIREMGYYVWTAPQEKGSFISEGDTPTFMNLLDNGLRAYEDSSFGGWGGRVRAETPQVGRGAQTPTGPAANSGGAAASGAPASNSALVANANPIQQAANAGGQAGGRGAGGFGRGPRLPVQVAAVYARFFVAAQNDFAARLKWSVTSKYSDANHNPIVTIDG